MPPAPSSAGWGAGWALAACIATTALAVPFRAELAEANLILLYLLAVVLVTVRFGRWPGILASVVAVLAFDVVMVPPFYSLHVAEPRYLVTLAIMLVVSLLVSHLTAVLRGQAEAAARREVRAQVLFALSRELSGALVLEQIGEISARHLGVIFHADATLLFPDAGGAMLAPPGSAASPLQPAARLIARTVFEREVTTGYDEGATASGGIYYLPLRAPMRTRGVMVLAPRAAGTRLTAEQERLLQTCAATIALAIERVHYIEVAGRATLAIESERLRNSLLSAISHDIRTPLTAIVGLSSTLASESRLPEATRLEVGRAIQDASQQMDNLVTNLLDMARLHDGAIRLNLQWQMLEEVVGSALAAMGPALNGIPVQVDLPAALPLVQYDAVLIERVLCNLLDNAAKYGLGSQIAISARDCGATVELSVQDGGPGLPPAMGAAIFDKFVRGDGESAQPGVGLGLAICKAIVDAHGGTIRAASQAGGACFTLALPAGHPPTVEQ